MTNTELRATALPVSLSAIQANAGTNLNTSALAVETGGNLAAIKAKTDNIPAVGQAVMAASVPVVLASNQSAVPTSEATKTLTTITGTVATSGHNPLVAAPGASNRFVVVAFVMQNEAATANTMILEDGSTAKWRCLGQSQGDGLSMVFQPGREWRLTSNAALQINLSASTAVGYSITYYVEAV